MTGKKNKKQNKHSTRGIFDGADLVGDNGATSRSSRAASFSEDDLDVTQTPLEQLKGEIHSLKQTVNILQQQVSFLLTFVGAVDPTPPADYVVNSSSCDTHVYQSKTATAVSVSDSDRTEEHVTATATGSKLSASMQQSLLCQAVTSAVYLDMHTSELKAKNVIINGLEESDTHNDKTLAI